MSKAVSTDYKTLQETLKPCPFCGNQPELAFHANQYGRCDMVMVLCRSCDVAMKGENILWATEKQTFQAFAEVSTKWNKRSTPHE